jgi:hypothetical protein
VSGDFVGKGADGSSGVTDGGLTWPKYHDSGIRLKTLDSVSGDFVGTGADGSSGVDEAGGLAWPRYHDSGSRLKTLDKAGPDAANCLGAGTEAGGGGDRESGGGGDTG